MTENIEKTNQEITMSDNEKTNQSNGILSPFDDISPVEGLDGTAHAAAMGVPVTVEVVVGRTKLTVADVMDIRRGKVIELNSKAGDLVDITVNGKVLARGELNIFEDGRTGVTFVEIL